MLCSYQRYKSLNGSVTHRNNATAAHARLANYLSRGQGWKINKGECNLDQLILRASVAIRALPAEKLLLFKRVDGATRVNMSEYGFNDLRGWAERGRSAARPARCKTAANQKPKKCRCQESSRIHDVS